MMRRIERDFDCLCSGGSIEFHPCCPGRSQSAARNVETAARDRPGRPPPRDHGRRVGGGGDDGGGGARAAGRTARADGCDTCKE